MNDDDSESTNRVALALCASLCERLEVEDDLDGLDVYRSTKTLNALALSALEHRSLTPALEPAIGRLIAALTVRLGESVDGSHDDQVYQLGRAIEVTSQPRRRCRHHSAA